MKSILDNLESLISAALEKAAGQPAPAIVKPTQDERFGHYQANGVMAVAKKLKLNPRELAAQVVAAIAPNDIIEPPEIAGPGFINLRLRPAWLAERLAAALADPDRLGINLSQDSMTRDPRPATRDSSKIVIDFSGPNIAKEMHVGHLRSTIIGDSLANILEFWSGPGTVIRQNHVGDWGTQFGMLIAYREYRTDLQANAAFENGEEVYEGSAEIANIEQFYRQAKAKYDADPEFAKKARNFVVKLQSGDPYTLTEWKTIVEISLAHCQSIYNQLGVSLTKENVRGESFYNPFLSEVIDELKAKKLLAESEGAQVVFLEGFKDKEGNPLPLIVQKTDGAYLYATTDLAGIRYRTRALGAQRIIYVTDSRQKLHFEMVFAAARAASFAGEAQLEHVPFGSVLGEDGKPFKTRSGENVKLQDLLDEAVQRARAVVEQKNPELPAEQKAEIARAVGIGAVKYADLSSNLTNDYVFSWDRMLSLDGNTAPYMQYAFARTRSIFRKGEIDTDKLLRDAGISAGDGCPRADTTPPGAIQSKIQNPKSKISLDTPEEFKLALQLLKFADTLDAVARDLRPHLLTTYLFDLAQAFSAFYLACPVLKAPAPLRASRLLLCLQTARTLQHGLALLGIATPGQM